MTVLHRQYIKHRRLLSLISIALLLSACGGGSGDGDVQSSSNGNSSGSTNSPSLSLSSVNVTVSWAGNSDPDLNGYYVYHGVRTTDLTNQYFVAKDKTSYTLTVAQADLGDHYFAITTIDNAGNESARSEMVHLSVQKP